MSGNQFQARFNELSDFANPFPRDPQHSKYVDRIAWAKWCTNALQLLELTFGKSSPAYSRLASVGGPQPQLANADVGIGAFFAAKEDFEKGLTKTLAQTISGEVFSDFVLLAKGALAEGHKDVAAVLACAALEDALKRYASSNGIDVSGKTMDNVVGLLKSHGLVQGAQKGLLEAMPRLRNCAMHADWAKISEPDVNSVIGFVESFIQTKF